jgi:predicted ATP-grasp superfamily ATP-dependent carboligase
LLDGALATPTIAGVPLDTLQRELIARSLRGARAPALVVDVGWVNGLAAIRSLGRAGIPVLALDHRASPLGFRSRYAVPVRCPDPLTEEPAFVELLAELGEFVGAPAPVFATHDEGLNAIARNADALAEHFRFPFPPWQTLERVQKKSAQLERANEVGVDVPRTRRPATAQEARTAASELGLPVLVKPSDPVGFKRRFRRQAFRCETLGEVEDAYARAEPFAPMVQELVPGGDDALYTVGSYLAEDGRALGVFCGRKLRQAPRGIGTCRVGEAVWVQEVVDAALRLLGAFEYNGLSQVELKRDARDGRYRLMEINPRLWQWHGLAAACGVDLPRIAYADLVGESVPPAEMNGDGKRWAITLLAGEPPVFLRPPYVDAVFARDDPKPAFVQAARFARAALS